MKIGIITLVSDNYGNKYQNYAVEQLLSKYGETVTYRLENCNPAVTENKTSILRKLTPLYISKAVSARLMNCYDITNARRSTLGNLIYYFCHQKQIQKIRAQRHQKFLRYQQQYLHISDRVITKDNCNEKEWIESHSVFVCGSDQIWNPNYGTTSDLAFLSFAVGKSVAFAPSFGVSSIPESLKLTWGHWINDINFLSVREDTGCQIIKELTGRDAEVLLDPTMAIEPFVWSALAKSPSIVFPQKYILTYFLGRMSDTYFHHIRQVSEATGLPVVNLFSIEDPMYYSLDPNEVLYAIQHATIVLTDSFHGSVFSILFQRGFLVFPRDDAGTSMHSRISTLLEKFGLEDRLYSGSSGYEPLSDEKWLQIHAILSEERQKTRAYLDHAIRKEQ